MKPLDCSSCGIPVARSAEDFRTLCDQPANVSEESQLESAKSKLLNRISQAEHEYATGQFSDGAEFIKALRVRYGI